MSRSLSILSAFTLVLVAVGCEAEKPEMLKALEEAGSWTSDFERKYPKTIAPFTESPSLTQTGNIGITKDRQFSLRNFPEERLSEIHEFSSARTKAQALNSVTIVATVPANVTYAPEIVKLVTLRYYSDGRIEDSRVTGRVESIPEPNINGQPIKLGKQGGTEQPATRSQSTSESIDKPQPEAEGCPR
jgi:hypothetical protein